jgi:peptidoglycan/LPS O-acetylase OafA/YrhL
VIGNHRINSYYTTVSNARRSFLVLDGLRGIAALVIITRHAPAYFGALSTYIQPQHAGGVPLPPIGPFFESYLAVDFFFALSGFVMAHAYEPRLRDGMSAWQFMIVRIIRLYPLYMFGLMISAVLDFGSLMTHADSSVARFVGVLLPALFLLPSPPQPGSSDLFPLNEPAWSLFFELLANLCFGIIGRRLGNRLLGWIVLIAGLSLVGAVETRMFGFGSAGAGAMLDGYEWGSFGAGVLRVGFSFFAGTLVYRVWTVRRASIKFPPFILCVVLFFVFAAHPSERYQAGFDLLMTIVVFPLIILVGASCAVHTTMARIFAVLGVTSYAIYVLQEPIYKLTLVFFHRILKTEVEHFQWYAGVIFVISVFLFSLIVDRYIDSPVRAMLVSRLVPRRSTRPAANSTAPVLLGPKLGRTR